MAVSQVDVLSQIELNSIIRRAKRERFLADYET